MKHDGLSLPEGARRHTGPLHVFWLAVLALTAANLIGHWVAFLCLPECARVRFVPDDTYYYLTLVRNFAHCGAWTFDGGQTVTSGFHLLWAYLLLSLFQAVPLSEDGFVTAAVLLGFVVLLVPLALVLVASRRRRSWVIPATASVLLTSANFALNSVSGMEWSLALTAAALYAWVAYRAARQPERRRVAALLFALGVVGSLARTDFGLLPLGLALAAVLVDARDRRIRQAVPAAIGLLGAVTGVALGLMHSLVFTGEWLQSSSRTKAFWGRIHGYDPLPAVKWAVKLVLPADTSHGLTAVLGGAMVVVLAWFAWQARDRILRWRTHASADRVLGLGCAAAILGYFVFYGFNSGSCQYWYTANLAVPTAVCVALVLAAVGTDRRARSAFSALRVALVGANTVLLHVAPPAGMPHQERMLVAGRYVRSHAIGPVGAWNAGIIGYYAGGRVVNLDGLVNNEVYPYLIAGRLRDYVVRKEIRYVVDFESMLEDELMRRRGGYADGRLVTELHRVHAFPPWPDESDRSDLVLWEVLPHPDLCARQGP